jgi:GlpG protein
MVLVGEVGSPLCVRSGRKLPKDRRFVYHRSTPQDRRILDQGLSMRQIGSIPDENEARALADYLMTLGITTRLDPAPEGWAVWVHREERVEEARNELAEFHRNPTDPKYHGAASAAKALRKKAERVEREHLRNTLNVRYFWSARDVRRCPLTFLLIGASVAVALLSGFGRDARIVAPLQIASYRAVPLEQVPETGPTDGVILGNTWLRSDIRQDLRRGQIWRLVTPIFLHFDLLHLLFNMYWVYSLGAAIEIRRGTGRLAALVLGSAALSNLGQYFYSGSPLFGGMSGVDFALFGYVWMKGLYEPELGLALHPNTVLFMVLYLGFTSLGGVSHMAHAAHLVGLAVGVLAGVSPYLVDSLRPRLE